MTARLDKLTAALQDFDLDAVILNPGPTLTYLTGLHFHLMERPVVLFFVPGKTPALVLPNLEQAKLQHLPFEIRAFPYGENPLEWETAFKSAVDTLNLNGKQIGMEALRLRLYEYGFVQRAANQAAFVDAGAPLASLRICKDPGEIENMRQAVQVAETALKNTLNLIKLGMTEREIAAELTVQLLRAGSAPTLPFSPIVSAGPNAANPHASPADRKIQHGDLLVIDYGATVNDYVSDITRTFAVGSVDAEYARIHQIVQAANAAGRQAAKPGVACAQVDIAARTVIENAGYGDYFTHRTGHGLGMDAHEAPYMRADNQQLLATGMAFTVEPGIYLPGRNGVRIEDDMLITTDGAESLTSLPREMQVIE